MVGDLVERSYTHTNTHTESMALQPQSRCSSAGLLSLTSVFSRWLRSCCSSSSSSPPSRLRSILPLLFTSCRLLPVPFFLLFFSSFPPLPCSEQTPLFILLEEEVVPFLINIYHWHGSNSTHWWMIDSSHSRFS